MLSKTESVGLFFNDARTHPRMKLLFTVMKKCLDDPVISLTEWMHYIRDDVRIDTVKEQSSSFIQVIKIRKAN